LIELKSDFKIYWDNFPIAKLIPGKDYLNPELSLIIDDMVENTEKNKLTNYLQNWVLEKINNDLKSLIDLKLLKENNPNVRALAFLLYENNGVVKRYGITENLKKLNQEDRKILRNLGVKFGRYHIFLFKLFKPKAVSLRILLWKNYHQKFFDLNPPTFGLNFLEGNKYHNKEFMLLCGFEKFDNFFVRIDILERLFIKIINSDISSKKEIKLIPEMLNLLGCSKENFVKIINKMDYKFYEKNNETYFRYNPKRSAIKSKFKTVNKDNPFKILNQINFK